MLKQSIGITTALVCVALSCQARTVFEDDFGNASVEDSRRIGSFWSLSVPASGDANALTESGGLLTMGVGSMDGTDTENYSGVYVRSSISSNYSFFSHQQEFRLRGISFDDHGSGVPYSAEQFRFGLLSDGGNSYAADDAVIVKVTPNGKIRLGKKVNDPGDNSDGNLVHEFSALGTSGTYGFDLILGPPVNSSTLEYRLEVYTGAVPVSVGVKVGTTSVDASTWGNGDGRAQLSLWAQENNITGGNQHFDVHVDDLLIQTDGNLLHNAGFEQQSTTGWQTFGDSTTLAMATSSVFEGTRACRVQNRGQQWHSIRRQLGGLITTGETYTASMWVRLGSGTPDNGTLQLKTTGSAGDKYVTIDRADFVSDAWTQIAGEFTFNYPGTISEAFIYVSSVAPGVDLLIDKALVAVYVPPPPSGTVLVIR